MATRKPSGLLVFGIPLVSAAQSILQALAETLSDIVCDTGFNSLPTFDLNIRINIVNHRTRLDI